LPPTMPSCQWICVAAYGHVSHLKHCFIRLIIYTIGRRPTAEDAQDTYFCRPFANSNIAVTPKVTPQISCELNAKSSYYSVN
jgi:hypothetical protein